MPSAAVSAESTSCPAACSSLVASARFAGVSSITRIVATTAEPLVRRRRRRACAGAGPAGPACSGSRRRPRAGRPGPQPDSTITRIALVSGSRLSSRRTSSASRPWRRTSIRIAAGVVAPRVLDGSPRALGTDHAVSVAADHLLQHVDDRGIVVHAEQHALTVARRRRRKVVAAGGRRATVEREDEVEDAPSARLALERDVAAHRSCEATADRQPEAGAGGGPLGVVELLEDHLLQLRGDAGPGVADCDVETSVVHPCCGDLHLARLGELERVPDRG